MRVASSERRHHEERRRRRALEAALEAREREVAALLARGRSLKQAAQQLGISPSTADKLRAGAYAKLAVRNRARLAQVAGLALSE